jgi:hypothetical protein
MAGLAQASIAKLDHLWKVVTGVDMHDQKRQRQRGKCLLSDPQERDRVLVAAEQEHRSPQLRDHLADQKHRFGLEHAAVRRVARSRSPGGSALFKRSIGL